MSCGEPPVGSQPLSESRTTSRRFSERHFQIQQIHSRKNQPWLREAICLNLANLCPCWGELSFLWDEEYWFRSPSGLGSRWLGEPRKASGSPFGIRIPCSVPNYFQPEELCVDTVFCCGNVLAHLWNQNLFLSFPLSSGCFSVL